jgi:NAD(P)H dehydrogenase (quinone)
MATIAVIYHSGYGHTEVIAKAVAEGVTRGGATAELHKIEKADQDFSALLEVVSNADGVIWGAPTYMGSLSAPFKAFADASSKAWMKGAWKDKIAAGFTNSGSMSGDKLLGLFQLAVLAAQHGMIWVGLSAMPNSGYTKPAGAPDATNRLGSTLGVMAQSDQASPAETPPEGDKETARMLGERVANITAQFLKGK